MKYTRYTTFITGPGRSLGVDDTNDHHSFHFEVMDSCVVAVSYSVIATFRSGRANTASTV